jgi:hypothetical protein
MEGPKREYRRTETGRKAWQSRNSGLPAAYRKILGLLRNAASADDILAGMRGHPDKQVQDWLDELETLCFVDCVPLAARAASSSRLPRAA